MGANSAILGAVTLAQLMRDLRRPRSAVLAVADRRLKRTLTLAYQHVPYYREVMDSAGFMPEKDYTGPGDLACLPILTREVLKSGGEKAFTWQGADLARYPSETTAGSTGNPLCIWRTPHARAIQLAKYMRILLANKYRLRDKVLGFRQTDKRVSQDESFLQRLGILRWRKVDYVLQPEALTDEFLAFQPDVLYGNRVHFDLVCQELEKRGIPYGRLKLALPGGEVVLKTQAQRYREVLGGEVAVTYGSTELGTLAFQVAPEEGLRLCEDWVHYEFLDSDGRPSQPGHRGRIVVTDLSNPLMPLIRYDQGDWVVLAERKAGDSESWSRLESVEGRQNDVCVLPDGSTFTFTTFYDVMCEYPGVTQSRIVRKTPSRFQVQLAGDPDYIASIRDTMMAKFRALSPDGVEFDIVRVEQIMPDPTGKLRMLVSEVDD